MNAVLTRIWNRVAIFFNELVREAGMDAVLRFVRSCPYACALAPWITGILLLLVAFFTSFWQVTADHNNGLWTWNKENDWGFIPGSPYNTGFIRWLQVLETAGLASSIFCGYSLLQVTRLHAGHNAVSFFEVTGSFCGIFSAPSILVGCFIFRTPCAETGPSFWLAFCAGLLHLPCGVIGLLVLSNRIRI